MTYSISISPSLKVGQSATITVTLDTPAAAATTVTIRQNYTYFGSPNIGSIGFITIPIGQTIGLVPWTPTAAVKNQITGINDQSLTNPAAQNAYPLPAGIGQSPNTKNTGYSQSAPSSSTSPNNSNTGTTAQLQAVIDG